MQKARRHIVRLFRPLVGVWFQELFRSPAGLFHLSFTVLVRYRSHGNIQPYRMVPADSRRIPRVPRYSGYRYAEFRFMYRIITVCGQLSKYFVSRFQYNVAVLQPRNALRRQRFGLFPVRSPLLGDHSFIFLPTGTKMFQFPALALNLKI